MDLQDIAELREITAGDGEVVIGAMVTQDQLIRDDALAGVVAVAVDEEQGEGLLQYLDTGALFVGVFA